mgnify:FL=1
MNLIKKIIILNLLLIFNVSSSAHILMGDGIIHNHVNIHLHEAIFLMAIFSCMIFGFYFYISLKKINK